MPKSRLRQAIIVLMLAAYALSACAVPASVVSDDVMEFASIVPIRTATPQPTPMPMPEMEITPEPVPVYAKIGAVGDIMMMQSQISGAWNREKEEYDFTPSFYGLLPWFSNTDVLIANLETPLAGADAGYSIAGSTRPTPDANGVVPDFEFQTFNAPDALAASLYATGFNVITTANNHCLDRGADGLFRTAGVLREAGITQLGSYISEEDRNTARVMEINGIRIGLLSWTVSVNKKEGMLSSEERKFAVGRTGDEERMLEDIRLAKEAGAEFVIAYPHWDVEFMPEPRDSTKRLARWLLVNGVDAIIGSHPHVPQPVEYITVEREDGEYTGLVAYSLGNFISNMAPSPRDYGVYLELTLEKTPDGEVHLYDAGILPLYCIKHRVEGRTLHEVIPALEDQSAITASGEVTDEILSGAKTAREYILDACKDNVAPIG